MTCVWTGNGEGFYDTDCDGAFEITSGTPTENGMKFCCYCGDKLEEDEYVQEEDS